MKTLLALALVASCGDNIPAPAPDASLAPDYTCAADRCGPMPTRYVAGDQQIWINTAEKWMECVHFYQQKSGCEAP